MGHVLELGRRVALQPMDAHCHDITIALYRDQRADGTPFYAFHSYSGHPDAGSRLDFLAAAACHLGGMVASGGRAHTVAWPCGGAHLSATRRLFVEVCKLAGPPLPALRPPEADEARSGARYHVEGLGGGRYRLSADAPGDVSGRLRTIAGGFGKLAEMAVDEAAGPALSFPCGQDHDRLVALLLPRALNARAAMREEESIAGRGVLVAPSAQNQPN